MLWDRADVYLSAPLAFGNANINSKPMKSYAQRLSPRIQRICSPGRTKGARDVDPRREHEIDNNEMLWDLPVSLTACASVGKRRIYLFWAANWRAHCPETAFLCHLQARACAGHLPLSHPRRLISSILFSAP